MKIYLAGKMDQKHGAWRDALIDQDWHNSRRKPFWELVRDSNESSIDWGQLGIPPWPTTPNKRVLDLHEYVGPYRTTYTPEIESKYTGYFHGSTVTGQHGQSNWDDHPAIIQECWKAIKRTDLFFAYINSPDCFGTIAEIGMAKAHGIYVVGAFETGAEWAWSDYWFCGQLCDAVVRVPEPIAVGARPEQPERVPGAMYGVAATAEWLGYREQQSAWSQRQEAEIERVRGLLKEAILQWTARPVNPASVALAQQDEAEPYIRALQESARSFSQIARWSADPRVREEAQKMLRRISG